MNSEFARQNADVYCTCTSISLLLPDVWCNILAMIFPSAIIHFLIIYMTVFITMLSKIEGRKLSAQMLI